MEDNEVLAKIGLSCINGVKLVCFLSVTGITHLVERAKARVSTSHDSIQPSPAFDTTV